MDRISGTSKILSIFVSAYTTKYFSKLFLSVVAVLFSISFSTPVFSQTPLPSLSDQNLQACLDEHVAANGWVYAEDVTELRCSDRNIESIHGLENLLNLRVLDVSDNRIGDIWLLMNHTQLEVLWLSDNLYIDGDALAMILMQNVNITELGVSGAELYFLDYLSIFSDPAQYTVLDVSGTRLLSLEGIEDFINLRRLDASDNSISDVLYLTSGTLPWLKELHLENNQIVDVSPLQSFVSLEVLWLSGNSGIVVDQLLPIVNQNIEIRELGLGGIDFNYEWIPFDLNYDQLIALDISNTGIEYLGFIEHSANLQRLDASGNTIRDLFRLSNWNIKPLTELRLANTQIEDISPLLPLTELEILWLSGNNLVDIDQLMPIILQNTSLGELGLGSIDLTRGGQYSSNVPLFGGIEQGIVNLDISNTNIDNLFDISAYALLEQLEASNNYIGDISPLMMLEEIRLVDLYGNPSIPCYQLEDLEWKDGFESLVRPATCTMGFAPSIDVLSPNDGATFIEGMAVNLSASASDIEDGDMGAVIAWSSDLSGTLGIGSDIYVQLVPGVHGVTAEVTDSDGNTSTQSVQIEVLLNNSPQISLLSPISGTVYSEGDAITFSAEAVDAEDGDLSGQITWTSSLDGGIGSGGGFTSQLSPGVHTITISVTDSLGKTASASSVVEVNIPPMVDAGMASIADEGTIVPLIGTASDSDGSIVTYEWVKIAGPDVDLNSANSAEASFIAPLVDSDTTLTFMLTVTDDDGASRSDTVNVTVTNVLVAPTADAGTDQGVRRRAEVFLDGTASYDANGTIVTYEWVQVAGDRVSLSNVNSPIASFTAPPKKQKTNLIFELRVVDNDGGMGTDQIEVAVTR